MSLQPARYGGLELTPQQFFSMQMAIAEGGFRFSGRWGWSSGSDHCTWALLGGIIPGEGYRTFLVPAQDYQIIDTWQSMGLQGTGSNDIVVEDVFVPDYRTHKQMDGFLVQNPGRELNPQPLFQIPWAQIFIRTVSSPAIGACREALRLFQEGALNKQSADLTKLAGSEIQQRFLDIHTARAHVANNPTSFGRNLGATRLGVENQDFFV